MTLAAEHLAAAAGRVVQGFGVLAYKTPEL